MTTKMTMPSIVVPPPMRQRASAVHLMPALAPRTYSDLLSTAGVALEFRI
jgi:hypothetical protein